MSVQSGFVLMSHSLGYYFCDNGLHYEMAEKWSFGRGRPSPLFSRVICVPVSRNYLPDA